MAANQLLIGFLRETTGHQPHFAIPIGKHSDRKTWRARAKSGAKSIPGLQLHHYWEF